MLQLMGRTLGILLDLTPKCRCELASKGIAYSWGCAKNSHRQLPLLEKRKKESFLTGVRKVSFKRTSNNRKNSQVLKTGKRLHLYMPCISIDHCQSMRMHRRQRNKDRHLWQHTWNHIYQHSKTGMHTGANREAGKRLQDSPLCIGLRPRFYNIDRPLWRRTLDDCWAFGLTRWAREIMRLRSALLAWYRIVY